MDWEIIGELDMNFGERLIQARKALGLNQSELARRTGITRSAISQLERDERRRLSMDNLFKVAKVLQVNPEWLATGEGTSRGGFYPLPADDEAQAIALRVDRLDRKQRDALKRLLDSLEP